jgi:hypothetical protein
MCTRGDVVREVPPIIHANAPAERLAAVRIAVGVFALVYVVSRIPVFLQLRDRSADDFLGVGVFRWLEEPLPDRFVTFGLAAAVASGIGFVAGAWFVVSGPVFAVTVLGLTTYRSSWGQLLHFENLMVLHLAILAIAASADAWSCDARRRSGRRRVPRTHEYSAPLRLVCIVVVLTYVIAGIAKLRYGGLDWIFGDALRNHVAYSAARLDLLGGTPSPLAGIAVRQAWMFPPMAAAAVVIELVAPMALFGGWCRNVWVGAAWLMHLGIAALMLVAFPYPLFLLAFAPFFALERLVRWLVDLVRSVILSGSGRERTG